MPELKGKEPADFQPVDIDINEIKYLNEKREAVRLNKLEHYKCTGVWPSSRRKKKTQKQSTPWAESKQRRIEKKEKKHLKREKISKLKIEGVNKKRKRKAKFTQEEIDELAKDISLIKKLKNKKISSEQFDDEMGIAEL